MSTPALQNEKGRARRPARFGRGCEAQALASAWVQKRGLEYWQSLANNLGNRLGPAYQLGKSWDFWFE